MHFRLVRSVKRKGTINRQFSQRIPADVKARAVGLRLAIPIGGKVVSVPITDKTHAVRLSLRSFDPSEVKERQAQIAGYLETVWRALRQDAPLSLSHRQATALAKDIYDGWAQDEEHLRSWAVERDGDDMVSSADTFLDGAGWESAAEALLRRDPLGREPEEFLQPLVQDQLLGRGIGRVDEQSVSLVTREFIRAIHDALALQARHAEGDYSPGPAANRFPEFVPSNAGPAKPKGFVSLKGLVEEWWKEAERAGRSISTYESYKSAVCRLTDFLKHDNAADITPANIVAFKDHRLGEGVSPKTIGDSDVPGLRAIFKFGVANLKLSTNPAERVTVTRPKAIRLRERSFTPEEAKAILSHSLHHQPKGKQGAKLLAAKRWVPWLCAYTGARLGEMVQLRKQDIRQRGDMWVLTITPEAGTVKDKELREVVLHAHLVEQGFTEFVTGAHEGYLFLEITKPGEVRGQWRTVKNRLREFAREVVKDPNVQPNHGWRHMFKTVGREAGIADSVLDAICGHAAKTVGGSYGGVTLKTQADAMEKFPRFAVK